MLPAIDPNSLFIELIVSSVGFGLLMYGKKAERWPQMIAGVLLIGYPYVVSSTTGMMAVGAAIVAGLFAALWLGW